MTVPVGTKLFVFHQYLLGTKMVATLEVIQSAPGVANVRSMDGGPLLKVARGERIGRRQPMTIVPSVNLPKHLLETDRMMRFLPRRHLEPLIVKYAIGGISDRERAFLLKCSRETYRQRVACAEEWIAGYTANHKM